jgi:hypothetical protein
MIRDSQPVAQQVKSGLKIGGALVVVCAALFVLAPHLRSRRLEAMVWHWRNGNSINVGEFAVPVPSGWMVQRFEVGRTQEVYLINTRGGEALSAVIIITDMPGRNTFPLNFAGSRRRTMESFGLHVSDTRELVIGGVNGSCLDGETMRTGISRRDISCSFGTSLSVEYVGSSPTAPMFYSILDGIAKTSKG